MNGLYRMRPGTTVAVLLALCVLAPAAFGAPIELVNGVPVAGISGAGGSQKFYVISVPPGQDLLDITITGGTGDCDLYVRKDYEPTLTSYDYRPYQVGNEEKVVVDGPGSGGWYIMLNGYTAYAGLTLTATFSAANEVVTLVDGLPVANLAGLEGSERFFKIDVPSGRSKLEIKTSGGTGDCDLYVKFGSVPTTFDYDYRPFVLGNDETVTVDNPAAGTWYIMLKGYDTYAGLTLVATHGGGMGLDLQNGVPVPNLSGTQGSQKFFRIEVPAGQDNLKIAISGGTGDCDLHVKFGAPPTLEDYDYRPYLSGNNEEVSVDSPAEGTWYIMLHAYNPYTNVTLVASYGGVIVLEDGVAITGISGPDGDEKFYRIDVPLDQVSLEIAIAGGTGNCDLYVKFGQKPTVSNWDYRPQLSDNNETVTIENPQSGSWYIMLKAQKAYQGVTLLADYWAGDIVTPLTNGVPVSNISGAEGSEKYYVISVPADQDTLEIAISGGTGDADLYVKRGQIPTLISYDYRPYLLGNDETVTVENPAAGDWYIMIRGYRNFAGVTLLATHRSEGPGDDAIPLTNGVPVLNLTGAAQSEVFYKIDVPANQMKLTIGITGGSGDADLYIRKGALPTVSQWDYRPYLIGNEESVTIDDPGAGVYYIMIRGYTGYAGVTLQATYWPIPGGVTELVNGVPVPGLSGNAGSETMYRIEIPEAQDYVDISISGGTGDCDLYVKIGAQPTTTDWDYRPYLAGNDEVVHVETPTAGTWYVMLRGKAAYAGVTLLASYGVFGAGNNFLADPNCVALWTFEEETLAMDLKGTNDLENHGVSVKLDDFKEGAGCADFEATQMDWMLIDDDDLSLDFPTRSNTMPGYKISICYWMKLESYSFAGTIMSKYLITTDDRSWRFWLNTGKNELSISLGKDAGNDFDSYLMDVPEKNLALNNWYHVAFTYDDATRNYHVRIWDDTTGTLYCDVKGVTFWNVSVTDAPLAFGNLLLDSAYFDGQLDEVAVFKDVLTDQEIDQIRQGAYMNVSAGKDPDPGQQK